MQDLHAYILLKQFLILKEIQDSFFVCFQKYFLIYKKDHNISIFVLNVYFGNVKILIKIDQRS